MTVYDGAGEAEMIIKRIVGEIDEEKRRFVSRAVAYSGGFKIDIEVKGSRVYITCERTESVSIYFRATFTNSVQ